MKNIKNLGIKSLEGFEIKNLQRFPSMEWGPEGGLQADIFFEGKKFAQIYDAGDGGCASGLYDHTDPTHKIAKKCLEFLKRLDKAYDDTEGYDFLKHKTELDIDADDWEAVINIFEERYDDIKEARNCFKKGYKSLAAVKNHHSSFYLRYRVDDITPEEVISFVKLQKKDFAPERVDIIRCNDDLVTL